MDSSLDDLVKMQKKQARAAKVKKSVDAGDKKGPVGTKKVDALISQSLDDIIASDKTAKGGKKTSKGKGKGKGKGGKSNLGERQNIQQPRQGKARGKGFQNNRGNFKNFSGGDPAWDYTDYRARSRSPPARVQKGTYGRRIQVTNIPSNLAPKDLEEAFLEVGAVEKVEVGDGGKAWVVFSSSKEAYEAEHRYDGGQINHQIIRVSVV